MIVRDKRRLRAVMKWALRPSTSKLETHDGQLHEWAEKKLNALCAFGMADKSKLSARAVKCVQSHYVQGIPLRNLAREYGVSEWTIKNDLATVIDSIIAETPMRLLAAIFKDITTWRTRACLKCGGDLYWDNVGAYGKGGEYCCLQCGTRHKADGKRLGGKGV